MKPLVRKGLGLLLIVFCALVWSLTSGMSARKLRGRTCQGGSQLDVIISDSLERSFVKRADIEKWLEEEYRAYAGLPLDSVNLYRIESIIQGHSVVRDCQAWLTDDGILHVELSQREPVILFDDGANGFYADATGFIFPLQSKGIAEVPVVEGRIPLKVERGFKGYPEDPQEKAWLEMIIGLVKQMRGTVWERNIARITVDREQNLVLTPLEGKEQFIFGAPVRVEEKFRLMEAYYESVVPSKEKGWYKTVDLRYRGQLVCRK